MEEVKLISVIATALAASVVVAQTGAILASEKTMALSRMKHLSLATTMYTMDYDDCTPFVSSTKDARIVLKLYVDDQDSFVSPRANSQFLYNVKIGGLYTTAIPSPADEICWYEKTPVGIDPVVAFLDARAKVIMPAESEKMKKTLTHTFKRDKSMKVIKVGSN